MSVYLTWALMILWAGGPCMVLLNIVGLMLPVLWQPGFKLDLHGRRPGPVLLLTWNLAAESNTASRSRSSSHRGNNDNSMLAWTSLKILWHRCDFAGSHGATPLVRIDGYRKSTGIGRRIENNNKLLCNPSCDHKWHSGRLRLGRSESLKSGSEKDVCAQLRR